MFEVLIRFPAAVLAVVMALLIAFGPAKPLTARIAGALLLSIAAMLLSTAPGPIRLPRDIVYTLYILSTPIVPLIWWFGLSIVSDGFKLKWMHWILFSFYVVLDSARLIAIFSGNEAHFPGELVGNLLWGYAYGLMIHLFVVSFMGMGEDLVNSRRIFRVVLAFFLIAVEATTLAIGHFWSASNPGLAPLLNTSIAAALVLGACLGLLRFKADALSFKISAANSGKKQEIDPKFQLLNDRLDQLMIGEQLYQEQGLTIKRLADQMQAPEHQVRALINQILGFRNFSSFLNTYRIAYAKDRLKDISQANVLVLTIAMDAGYASLSSFNRAFRDCENETPSDFRSRAFGIAERE